MRLAELVRVAGVAPPSIDVDVEVTDLTHDSRQVTTGSIFACIRGASHDGHDHAPDAVAAGAPALVVDHELRTGVPEIVVPDVRQAVGPIASVLHGSPSTLMPVIGVTGTNGKTTVTHLLGGILDVAGLDPLVIGTLSGARTTPEGADLQRELARAHRAGARAVAMEVSSHALALHRVDGTTFAVSVFTNLGLDHLDFHRDFEDYFAAKARLFDRSFTRVGVVCRDDRWGRRLIEEGDPDRCEIRTYGADDATAVLLESGGSSFDWRGVRLRVHLPGRHNVLNALAAATVAHELGIGNSEIAEGLDRVLAVSGRFEPVHMPDSDIDVIVDYAHKPDALAAVLEAAREITSGSLVVVIGAGGDRDAAKRPVMGSIAAGLADTVIVTNDNPRSEEPLSIIAEIVAGMDDDSHTTIEPDRAVAIRSAILGASPGDLIVLAGKGHETTQTTGDVVVDFDDADHARRAMTARPSIGEVRR